MTLGIASLKFKNAAVFSTVVFMLALPVLTGVYRGLQQQRAIVTFSEMGATVRYAGDAASAPAVRRRETLQDALSGWFGDEWFGTLSELDLGQTRVADADLVYLDSLWSASRMSLRDTSITDASVPRIAGLAGLEWLDVRGTRISDEALAALRRKNPRLRILSDNAESSSATNQLTGRATVARPQQAFVRRTIREANSVGSIHAGLGTKNPGDHNESPAPSTLTSIDSGIEYLRRIQSDDGSWRFDQGGGVASSVPLRSPSAATGLALLSLLGAGHDHVQGELSEAVFAGLSFLIENQKGTGDLFIAGGAETDKVVWLYSHGIAALALCEAYGMTQDPWLQRPAQAAIDFACETQDGRLGGWRYTPGRGADLSVTGWIIMALKSGELAGLEVPASTWAGVNRWLDSAQAGPDRPHLYVYNPLAADQQKQGRDANPTMTAVGLLMRLYTGWPRGAEQMKRGADYLRAHAPQAQLTNESARDAYYWYYATQVMLHMGDEHWKAWNLPMHDTLVESQIGKGEFRGSWDPLHPVADRWASYAGRLYVTTLNLLTLEVYYRHLPIYENFIESQAAQELLGAPPAAARLR